MTWELLVFFASSIYSDSQPSILFYFTTMIGDLGIVGLICDCDWQLGYCWVSSFALREYVVVCKIDKLLCVGCVDHT